MRDRLHATGVVARTQLKESLLSPSPYVAVALALGIAFRLCEGFVRAVDSSGFDSRLDSVWDFLTRALSGPFGAVLVEKLFTEGPFLAILVGSIIPIFLSLAIASVFRFGMEKATGAVELFAYGPADGTAYFLGSFLKDAVLWAGSLALLAAFCAIMAAAQNLVMGPQFFAALPVVFLLALSFSALGILCSTLVSHPAAALGVFLAAVLVFGGAMAGSLGTGSSAARAAAQGASLVIQWVSPLFYAALAARGFGAGSAGGYVGGLALLAALSAALLAVSHFVLGRRGVRA